jgi:hypothetical protein
VRTWTAGELKLWWIVDSMLLTLEVTLGCTLDKGPVYRPVVIYAERVFNVARESGLIDSFTGRFFQLAAQSSTSKAVGRSFIVYRRCSGRNTVVHRVKSIAFDGSLSAFAASSTLRIRSSSAQRTCLYNTSPPQCSPEYPLSPRASQPSQGSS